MTFAISRRRRGCGPMMALRTTLMRCLSLFALRLFALRLFTQRLPALPLLALAVLATSAAAGTLQREQVQAMFPSPLVVGEKMGHLPVWPVLRRVGPNTEVIHYAFETVDLEPVAGYGGKPLNLFVVLDRDGSFLQSQLLSHMEPIFRSEKGTATLTEFGQQYQGLTVQHEIHVLTSKAQRVVTPTKATLHGVVAGTVTTTAIDRSIMESAAQVAQEVARAKTDGAGGQRVPAAPSGPDDRYQRTGWNGLAGAGLVQPWSLSQGELEAKFRGGEGAGRDAEGLIRPQALGIDLWLSWIGLPQAGRNVLEAPRWRELRAMREQGQTVLLVLDGGRHSLQAPQTDAGRSRGAELLLRQNDKSFALRELDWRQGLRLSGQHSGVASASVARYYTVQPAVDGARIDVEQPVTLALSVWRRTGDAPEAVARAEFTRPFAVPDAAAFRPVRETPRWLEPWAKRSLDLAVLAASLVLLVAALVAQRKLVASPQRLARFRVAFLLFTLVFVGWVAQGQLTIVSLTSMIEALAAGRSTEFLLADPMAVLLWGFTAITLLVWGRGTFCGWLCPFGALQELISMITKPLGVAQRRLRLRTDALLKNVKYAVLAVLVGASFTSAGWTEQLVEIEPFKTSISLHFQRDWPYLLWAVACLALGTLVYRGYCRYVCPLGALLALLGKVRMFDWIPRKDECGTPCQSCRHGCAYQAIEPSGKVDYDECFQCLDCVEIHDDVTHCLPLVRERKAHRVIPIQAVVPPDAAAGAAARRA